MKPELKTCSEVQVNRRAPDFTCDIQGGMGHKVHHDPTTGQRWSRRGLPPFRTKSYANAKLKRKSR